MHETVPLAPLVALVVFFPAVAEPCSPGLSGFVPGGLGGNVGPLPLLASTEFELRFEDETGGAVELQSVQPEGFDGATFGREALRFFRPVSPLSPGRYRLWKGAGFFEYTVVEGAGDFIPSVDGATARVNIVRFGEDDGHSCAGEDFSNIGITVPGSSTSTSASSPVSPSYLVTALGPDGRVTRRFVSNIVWQLGRRDSTNDTLHFHKGFSELGDFYATEVCLTIAGVSTDGALGTAKDLGCLDPREEEGFHEGEGSGCSSSRARLGLVPIAMLMLGLWRALFSRTPPAPSGSRRRSNQGARRTASRSSGR